MPSRGKKSLAARGETSLHKWRGSGFEEGYADPPMTPAESATEAKLYDLNRPFPERIEECIQRYTTRRRMKSERSNVFSKYLTLGGIDTSQRQFTGTAKHLKDMKESGTYDEDDIHMMTSNDILYRGCEGNGKFFNPDYPEHWDVDFAGLVAGYLGDWLPKNTGLGSPDIKLAAETVLNFLKYVRHHDVCPEYADNLAEACKICELASTEIPRIGAVGAAMPGDFNLACRILFCGTGKTSSVPKVSVATDDVLYEEKIEENVNNWGQWNTGIIAPRDFDADRIFKATISIHEPDLIDRVLMMKEKPIQVVETYEDAYMVKDIVFSDGETVDIYRGIKGKDGQTCAVAPVGYVVLVPTIVEDGWDNHPTLAEGRVDNPGKTVSLYLEHSIMDAMKVGMKMRLTITELDIGVDFIKECTEVLPSFHVFLPQTLMMTYKAPKPNDRLPPSVDDPDAEEDQLCDLLATEDKDAEKLEKQLDPEFDRKMREAEDDEALIKTMERVKISS
ncbi:Argonaute-binding protein 1 [Cytospora mali]|uniref:Argonaute-binding protein 1 n=1 Tax=Cytospora mali TaxID=578113 RepID=A0A194V0V5_CYTMA|nr:Argonaute-binding protein 1 [Valsa mali var. pyri (nom. inval.)]